MVILIIQYNYRCGYKNIMIILKIALSIWARIIQLQKLFISNWELTYIMFNFYWPQRNKTVIRVMMIMKKNLLNKIVIEYRTNLVNYFYFILFEI